MLWSNINGGKEYEQQYSIRCRESARDFLIGDVHEKIYYEKLKEVQY